MKIPAHFVVTATVNEGRFSPDLLNRAVPIRLEATGDLARRRAGIGDPKGEFLPKNRDRIIGELHGMVERWKAAGMPLNQEVRHASFPQWASEVGGILLVSGFNAFLANTAVRQSEDDPIRRALAELGNAYPGEWCRTADWVNRIANLGLTKVLIPTADQGSSDGLVRGTGVVFSNHAGETFVAETEDDQVTLQLVRVRNRLEGGKPQTRYRFNVVDRRPTPIDTDA